MSRRSSWFAPQARPSTDPGIRFWRSLLCGLLAALVVSPAAAGDAPAWMHALTSVPLPAHDEKTTAVMLYSEDVLTVRPGGKLHVLQRRAYRILRSEGDHFGLVQINFDGQSRITDLHGWCIPASGKDYVVKEKDAAETALPGIENGELVSDLRAKLLRIPASVPGSTIGYEAEQDVTPYRFNDEWYPQETIPVREARYTLQLPPGWTFHANWIHHDDIAPTESTVAGVRQWQWIVNDLSAVRTEEYMPPWKGIAARMVVSVTSPDGKLDGWKSWSDLGDWYIGLVRDRRVVTPEISAKVAALTAGETSPLAKMRALARFVQTDIRYVAIELGIGGQQPHPATEVLTHRYGDCKDKATLLSAMLKVAGIDSDYVLINTVRGTVAPGDPANTNFDHAILAIRLPADVEDPALLAVVKHPRAGRLLFFDPTDTLTPLGRIGGELQANFGLWVSEGASELVALPQLAAETSGIHRVATMTLDEKGTLRGDVVETRVGDPANEDRAMLRRLALDTDRIKPIESRVASSLSNFAIVKASVANASAPDLPFEWRYSVEAEGYAKASGGMLLVRPRIVGTLSAGFLETKEPRQHPIEFHGPGQYTDRFEIELPPRYVADELPPPLNLDYDFASYHSKSEMLGNKLRYSRTLEIKQLSVPVARAEELKRFYRAVFGDERRTAVLIQSDR